MRFQRAAMLKDGDELLSCIVFTCLDGSAHISLMVTKRACAGRGLGTRLMRHFITHVRSLGLDSIERMTFSDQSQPVNASTISFYRSVGFHVAKVYRDLWGPNTSTLKMRLEIYGES